MALMLLPEPPAGPRAQSEQRWKALAWVQELPLWPEEHQPVWELMASHPLLRKQASEPLERRRLLPRRRLVLGSPRA